MNDDDAPPPDSEPAAPLAGQGPAIRNFALLVGAVLVGLAIWHATSGTGAAASGTGDAGGLVEVTYYVQGTTDSADITLADGAGGTSQQSDVNVPLTNNSGSRGLTFYMHHGDFAYISAQNKRGSGTISCQVDADGTQIQQTSSSGGYVIAECSAQVP